MRLYTHITMNILIHGNRALKGHFLLRIRLLKNPKDFPSLKIKETISLINQKNLYKIFSESVDEIRINSIMEIYNVQ